jgi:hypothetical protein
MNTNREGRLNVLGFLTSAVPSDAIQMNPAAGPPCLSSCEFVSIRGFINLSGPDRLGGVHLETAHRVLNSIS